MSVPAALSLLAALLLLAVACGGDPVEQTEQEPTTGAAATVDAEVVGEVAATFAAYRTAVVQGDGAEAAERITAASRDDQARIVELARTADAETVRALPAADQLLVLTYRLRPQLLEAEDPYVALADAGLAGQDRTLGDLGSIEVVGDDLAVAQVVAGGTPTPLRWRFVREGGAWRFDLADAQRLLSQAIGNGARQAEQPVSELVAATVVDLSGEDRETVEELYEELPG